MAPSLARPNLLNMLSKPKSHSLESRQDIVSRLTSLCVMSAPLFLVTINGWASAILFASALGAIIYLLRSGGADRPGDYAPDLRLLCLTLILPIAAILISSCFREKFEFRLFDSPSRFLIAIPIFCFVVRDRLNTAKYLQYVLPCSLIVTVIQQYTFHQPFHWGAGRMATYFVDPLTFGQYALTFGLMCLVSINLLGRDALALWGLKVSGVALGFYLSIQSGSRTGWLAAPLVIGFYILQRNQKIRLRHVLGAGALVAALLVAGYTFSPTIHQRAGLALQELVSYNWHGIAPDTSTGMRITFLRMGAELFMHRPWSGFGDTGIKDYLNDPQLVSFASQYTRQFALDSGFHNEFMTNAIRSGIWGVLAALALFVVPLAIFFRSFRSASAIRSANALLGITFVMCQLVSALSTEVLNLKFTASFYAILIACLCGSSIIRHESK